MRLHCKPFRIAVVSRFDAIDVANHPRQVMERLVRSQGPTSPGYRALIEAAEPLAALPED